MSYTNEQLTALESAIAEGVLSVKYQDREVTYRSLAEMTRLRDSMRAELGAPVSAASRSRAVTIKTGKWL